MSRTPATLRRSSLAFALAATFVLVLALVAAGGGRATAQPATGSAAPAAGSAAPSTGEPAPGPT
ncbi:MAG TPA: hypothetical protein VHE35_14175, partial [Kofleriaceae bacterium]|nr:hypothetical protein [Kofleriaceae bacterium]